MEVEFINLLTKVPHGALYIQWEFYGRGVATYGLNKIIGVGHDGGVSTSSDGGTTWHKQTIGEYANLVGVSFLLNDFFISDDYCAVFKMDSCLATIQPREDTLCNENDLVFDVSGLPAGIRQWYLKWSIIIYGEYRLHYCQYANQRPHAVRIIG